MEFTKIKQMNPEIKYIELKSGFSDDGPAWIGLVEFSKTGRTLYFDDKAFQSLNGTGIGANYFDVETGDEYWISGVKKNLQDRHWAGNGIVFIDHRIVTDYLKLINATQLDSKKHKIVTVIEKAPIERINAFENESFQGDKEISAFDLSFRQPNELKTEELELVINYLREKELSVVYNKARRSFKKSRMQFEEELENRKTDS